MLPVLIDEGLPASVAEALRALSLRAWAVGDDNAPPRNSADDLNVAWCARQEAVMVTNDRGRRERVILPLLASHRVHAIFVYKDLRAEPSHKLARALLCAEEGMHDLAARRKGLISHKLTPGGKLVRRGNG